MYCHPWVKSDADTVMLPLSAYAGQTPNTSVVLQHALARPANLVLNVGDLTYAGKTLARAY